ncbi:MAG: hypothetical protein IPJ30_16405 [Acidobacteria bacterium]|nr:hypothetical protein [Acidobacteriota bacterium]
MFTVLVVTAIQKELDAVLCLKPNGRADWAETLVDAGYQRFSSIFADKLGIDFMLQVTCTPQQGPVLAAMHTTMFLKQRPDLVFMTGICAGNPNKGVQLGDVIISDRAFNYETGKRSEDFLAPEIDCVNVDPVAVQWLKNFCAERGDKAGVVGSTGRLYVGPFATGSSASSHETPHLRTYNHVNGMFSHSIWKLIRFSRQSNIVIRRSAGLL